MAIQRSWRLVLVATGIMALAACGGSGGNSNDSAGEGGESGEGGSGDSGGNGSTFTFDTLGGNSSASAELLFDMSHLGRVHDMAYDESTESVLMSVYDKQANETHVVMGSLLDGDTSVVSSPQHGSGPTLDARFGIANDPANDRFIIMQEWGYNEDRLSAPAMTVDRTTGDREAILDPEDSQPLLRTIGDTLQLDPATQTLFSGTQGFQLYDTADGTFAREDFSITDVLSTWHNPQTLMVPEASKVFISRQIAMEVVSYPNAGEGTFVSRVSHALGETPVDNIGDGPGFHGALSAWPKELNWNPSNEAVTGAASSTLLSVDTQSGDRTVVYHSCGENPDRPSIGPTLSTLLVPGSQQMLVATTGSELAGHIYDVTIDPDGPVGGDFRGYWENTNYGDNEIEKRISFSGSGGSGTGKLRLFSDSEPRTASRDDLSYQEFDWTLTEEGTFRSETTQVLSCDSSSNTWVEQPNQTETMEYSIACYNKGGTEDSLEPIMMLSESDRTRVFERGPSESTIDDIEPGDPCEP